MPVVGMTGSGLVGPPGGDSPVLVAALGGPGLSARTAMVRSAAGGGRTAGTRLADELGVAPSDGHSVLLTFVAAGFDEWGVLDGLYDRYGAFVPFVGGLAGGPAFVDGVPVVAADAEATTSGAVAALLTSTHPLGIGVSHGWERVGEPHVVTGVEDHLVTELDGRPALDVWSEVHDLPEELRGDDHAMSMFGVPRPFSTGRDRGAEVVRAYRTNAARRALDIFGGLPEGELVWFMRGGPDTVLDATRPAVDRAFAALGGEPPIGVLAFSCMARQAVLGERAGEELELLDDAAGVPVAGCYTFGEVARTQGRSALHNHSLVVLAVS